MNKNHCKFAVIVIDLVNDFFGSKPLSSQRNKLVKNINQLVNVARLKNVLVVWVKQEFDQDLNDAYASLRNSNKRITIKDTPGSKLLPELSMNDKDLIVVKKRFSAFYGTTLEKILKNNTVSCVIICGVKTHACVRTSVIDAYQRDLEVIVAKDCVADSDELHGKISLKYFSKHIARLLNNSKIIKLLSDE